MKSANIFKKVMNVTNRQIVINIPEELINKEVEITIRPFKKETKKTRLLKIFNEYNIKLPEDYKFDREEIHVR